MERLEATSRLVSRSVTAVGLLMVYGWAIHTFLPVRPFSIPPDAFLKAGLVIAAVGCFLLVAALSFSAGDKRGLVFDVTLAFLCVPPVVACIMVAYGAEGELRLSWHIIAALLLAGAAGIVIRAAWMKQVAERWRNVSDAPAKMGPTL